MRKINRNLRRTKNKSLRKRISKKGSNATSTNTSPNINSSINGNRMSSNLNKNIDIELDENLEKCITGKSEAKYIPQNYHHMIGTNMDDLILLLNKLLNSGQSSSIILPKIKKIINNFVILYINGKRCANHMFDLFISNLKVDEKLPLIDKQKSHYMPEQIKEKFAYYKRTYEEFLVKLKNLINNSQLEEKIKKEIMNKLQMRGGRLKKRQTRKSKNRKLSRSQSRRRRSQSRRRRRSQRKNRK